MKTNLDKLHQTCFMPPGRRQGRTFLKCHDLAGLIELEKSPIIVEISYMHNIQFLKPIIDQVLREHHIVYFWESEFVIRAEKSVVELVTTGRYHIHKNTFKEHFYINMTHGE